MMGTADYTTFAGAARSCRCWFTIGRARALGVLSDGLVMLGVSSFWQMVIKGLVIIAAVVLDQMQRRMYRRFAPQAQLG
jgi:erythritol transport system permease protein